MSSERQGQGMTGAPVRQAVLDTGWQALRPLLFRVGSGDAEKAHEVTLQAAARAEQVPGLARTLQAWCRTPATPREVAGVPLQRLVGLAAGVDKNARALGTWEALGFGHVEIGTLTPRAQPGNPRPRMYRLPASRGVLNSMGFPNEGVEAVLGRLRRARAQGFALPVGVSIGKNKHTPFDEAAVDYRSCVQAVAGEADYLAINVSSPNTPGLRGLQAPEYLGALITAVVGAERERASLAGQRPTPVFCKLSPDLDDRALLDALEVTHAAGVSGLIATNTTLAREDLAPREMRAAQRIGGLSGAPLTRRARAVVRLLSAESNLPVIGVGGVLTVDDALALIDAGAAALQVYTGLIYGGPGLITGIHRALAARATH